MKSFTTLIRLVISCVFLFTGSQLQAQNCQIPTPEAGCTAPANFTFISTQDGNWTSGSTWVGGVAPSIENINNQQIKITHDVTVQNGNLKLDNNTVIYISGGGRLTLQNGSLYLEDGNQSSTERFLIDGGSLRTSGNVQQNGSATVFCAIGANLEIGDEDARSTPLVFTAGLFNSGSSSTSANFQNTKGYRRLENVCLNVTQDMQNDGGTDEFIGVCAEIGDQGPFSGPKNNSGGNSSFDGDDNGNFQFQSSSGTSTRIFNSEFYIPNGNIQNSKLMQICNSDFRLTNGSYQNQSGATIGGNDIVIWINNSGNGNIENSGTWPASTIAAWRTDNSNNPTGLSGLVAESSAAAILTHFNDCTCGGGVPSQFCVETISASGGFIAHVVSNYVSLANGNFEIPVLIFNFTNSAITTIKITTGVSPVPIISPTNGPYAGANFNYNVTNNNVDNAIFTGTNTANFKNGNSDLFILTVNALAFANAGAILTVEITTGATTETIVLEAGECGDINPLPVELLTFTGVPVSEGIDLKWNTASEKNNDRFDIERSADGKNFEKVGEIKGKGTTSAASEYNFLDKTASKGLNYYRLKQVDHDGTHAYSEVIKVSSEKGALSFGVKLIPNPCSDHDCSVLLQGVDASKPLVVEMRDLTGRVVFSQQVASDQSSFKLPKANLGKGIYILSAKNGLNVTYQKVIIQ